MDKKGVTDVLGYLHDMLIVPKNMDGDKIGGINRLFPYIFKVRLIGKKIKNLLAILVMY